MEIHINPLTQKKLNRFRSIRRGYWSLVILSALFLLTLFGELFVNNRALFVSYEGRWAFPILHSGIYTGEDFGQCYKSEARYRELQAAFEKDGKGNYVVMPIVPYGPLEQDFHAGVYPPTAPSIASRHFLGTDTLARDVLARLFYGFRVAMLFSLAFVAISFVIGIVTGCAMGYFGGLTDLAGQRFMEIWSNIPFLYLVIIMRSLIPTGAGTFARVVTLLLIMSAFSWVGIAYLMRTATYSDKVREYVDASRVLGAGTWRILFKHILPNTISIVVTLVAFIGEAVREAYDPRRFSTYR